MKKFGLLFVVVIFLAFSSQLSAQNVSPHFYELKGMQDAQGNTHLLYRINSYQRNNIAESGHNDVYNFIPGTTTDTIYFHDSYMCSIYMGWGETVIDYDYWDKDLTKFIYAGDYVTCFEPGPFISRFDSALVYNEWMTFTQDIFISKQNDSLVFGLPNLISNDGGFNWDTIPPGHQIVSVAEYDDQTYFCIDAPIGYSAVIFKSTDAGNTYSLVDTGGTDWGPKFYYDSNANHIYRTFDSNYPTRLLKGSSDQGNAFTWQTLYETENDILISLDESQSGAIYLADGNKIMFSSDYGNTFNLYKELDKRIIGIYKEPNSDKLYAATKYKLFEITNSTIEVIKSIPVIDELAFYPLQVGNRWVYNYTITDWNMNGSSDIFFREVLSEKIKQNGKKYFEILEKYIYSDITDTVYERIDSVEGKVYRYEADCPNSEQFIEDLVLEINDSTFASRFESCIEHPPTELVSEQGYNLWGLYGMNRNYLSSSLLTSDYNLYSDIGITYIKLSDDNYFKTSVIKGCVIDGIVYGDTTLTDIDDDDNGIPTSYKLEQNYPNPFNPTTKITWQSPVAGNQTLKVYDVLGNEVATLVDEFRNSGIYEIDFDASKLSSGVYFYQLKAGDFLQTKKMILIK
jgi:hypothetical protein